MAALVLVPGTEFDPRAFYAHATSSLPPYAVPVFVRVQREAEVTGAFKLRKVERVREGDDAAKTYEPLDAERYRAASEGRLRF